MKILITGAAGFIGSHLVERLLQRGDFVVGVDNFNDAYSPQLKRDNIKCVVGHKNMKIFEVDILDEKAMEDIFKLYQFDVVVHLAARAGVRPSLKMPLLYHEVNCKGTLIILELMKRYKVPHLVFASSSSVYGNSKQIPFVEDARIDKPVSVYAATKAAGELYCYNYYHLYGISVNVLRFFTVYGPRQRPDMAIHIFTKNIINGEPIPFYGDGTTERDYTFYTDIINGVVASIDRRFGFEIFNLGESQTTTLKHLVELLEAEIGRKAIIQRLPLQPGDVLKTCADVSKAKRLLGYHPSTPIEKGIKEFVLWYRSKFCK